MADPVQALVSRLRFRHLRMLVELQRSGSIGKAAVVLHLSQPALTKMLQEVEDAFGFALYLRTPRGLTPTPQGEAVLQGASVLLNELAFLHASARASMQQPTAVLHLGVPAAVAASELPAVLSHLYATGAPVQVRIREDAVPVLFAALAAGELDALLTSFTPALIAGHGTALQIERCIDHDYAVIAPARHALARRAKLAWQDLAQERWILPEPGLLARQGLDAHFVHAGVPVPQPAITANSPATTVQLVGRGLGIAWVAQGAMLAQERLGSIVRLRIAMQSRPVATALVYRSGTSSNPSLRLLRQAVAATRHEAGGASREPARGRRSARAGRP